MIKSYVAFHPSRPYWAVSPMDFSNQLSVSWFGDQMAEVVYRSNNSDYDIEICRDGRIMFRIVHLENRRIIPPEFDISKSIAIWSEYLGYLNAFYLLLDCATCAVDKIAIFNIHEITNRDAFIVTYVDGRHDGENIATESIASKFQMARFLSSYPASFPIHLNHDLRSRFVISEKSIQYAVSNFDEIFPKKELVKTLSVISKGLSEYKIGGYQVSIVLAWFEIEKILNSQWALHLESINQTNANGSKRINSDRYDALLGKHGFNSSQITNLLELNGILTLDEFADINKSRGLRNRIAHGHKFSPTVDDAKHVLEVVMKLLEKFYSIKLDLNFSYSITGM